MKTILAILVVLLAAYSFGPQLFEGEIHIHGLKTHQAYPTQSATPENQIDQAPAVYGPDGASPIFPEVRKPVTRPEPRKAHGNTVPAKNGATAPTDQSCIGQVCYYNRLPDSDRYAPMSTQ